jgi:hypothetical protein
VGYKTFVHTDHRAIKCLMNEPVTKPRIIRWLLFTYIARVWSNNPRPPYVRRAILPLFPSPIFQVKRYLVQRTFPRERLCKDNWPKLTFLAYFPGLALDTWPWPSSSLWKDLMSHLPCTLILYPTT